MISRTFFALLISALGLAAPTTNRSQVTNTPAFHVGNGAIGNAVAMPAALAENAAGSVWRPLSLMGCALALGTLIGALVTTGPYAPFVASVAGHAALLACT